jgi:hypothetical protein
LNGPALAAQHVLARPPSVEAIAPDEAALGLDDQQPVLGVDTRSSADFALIRASIPR